MANYSDISLDSYKCIIMDYSALFELKEEQSVGIFLDSIETQKMKVILGSSFMTYHLCCVNAMNLHNSLYAKRINQFVEHLTTNHMLIEMPYPIYSCVDKYKRHKDTCLFVGNRSILSNQLQIAALKGTMSVVSFSGSDVSIFTQLGNYINSLPAFRVNPIAASTNYLDVAIHCNVGDTVYTSDHQNIVLSEKISTGAEGLVFRTNNPKIVAKIYHRGILTPLRWIKLTRMTKKPIISSGICWPQALLYNQNNEPVGFYMSAGDGYTLGSVFDGPDAMAKYFPNWERIHVVEATRSVLEQIIYLHINGIILGDIQLKNLMISQSNSIYMIDMDSVQYEDLPCPVGTEEFTPPELWDRSFSDFLRNANHENYSCGILTFSLLFCGQHPYAQRLGRETLREEISAKAFPYLLEENKDSLVPVGGYDKIWDCLTDELKQMFISAFAEGIRYDATTWYEAVCRYYDHLSSHTESDVESYRVFPNSVIAAEVKEEKPQAFAKLSIRDAIIHNPLENYGKIDNSITYQEDVMYNGNNLSQEQQKFVRKMIVHGSPKTTHEHHALRRNGHVGPPITKTSDKSTIPTNRPSAKNDNKKDRFEIDTARLFSTDNPTQLILLLILLSLLITLVVMYILL